MSLPKLLLRAEGATVLIASVLAYRALHASWAWFAVLFLTPDLGMLGYLAGDRLPATLHSIHEREVATPPPLNPPHKSF